jgi:hypothetical protein
VRLYRPHPDFRGRQFLERRVRRNGISLGCVSEQPRSEFLSVKIKKKIFRYFPIGPVIVIFVTSAGADYGFPSGFPTKSEE